VCVCTFFDEDECGENIATTPLLVFYETLKEFSFYVISLLPTTTTMKRKRSAKKSERSECENANALPIEDNTFTEKYIIIKVWKRVDLGNEMSVRASSILNILAIYILI
jgi:hypothetical protein